jgi:4-hydroxy-tetrahydrodipicolinate synthase
VSERFKIIVPIVTPYRTDGGVDAQALAAHAEVLAEAGVDGFFVCGTNGEGPLLTDDEVVEATRAVARVAAGRWVIPQVGRPATKGSSILLQRTLDAGANAVAVVTPYFFELTEEGAMEHYGQLIAAAGSAPVYAYAIPAYAHNDLEPALVARLAAEGLAGIKDSTKSPERHRAYIALREGAPGGRFETFVGADALTLEAWRMGSSGAVPALANVRPELFVELVAAAEDGDAGRADELQEAVSATRQTLRGSGIATLKHGVADLMAGRGVAYRDDVRSPLPRHRPDGVA